MTFILINGAEMPRYHTYGAAGFDIAANNKEIITLEPGDRALVPTGLRLNMISDLTLELQIRSRSGMSSKKGLIVLNAPATIDPDYTGEILVLMYNASKETQQIREGERIAQGVFQTVYRPIGMCRMDTLRELRGFGSTGEDNS